MSNHEPLRQGRRKPLPKQPLDNRKSVRLIAELAVKPKGKEKP